MNDVATTVETYLAMWNEDDDARRAELISQAWASGGTYADPLLQAAGHAELSAMVDGVHQQYPGYRFRRTSGIDVHHDTVRFGWELFGPDGTVLVAGIDVGHLDADGKLRSIVGFFGELPDVETSAA
jgi:hypothetical protein